jgi:hypothetical protein
MKDERTFLAKIRDLFDDFKSFAFALEECRRLLVDRYKQAETGLDIDVTAFTGIHVLFAETLLKVQVDVKLVLPGTAQKRRRERDMAVVLQSAEAGPSSSKKNRLL